jgi:hypothetical protein
MCRARDTGGRRTRGPRRSGAEAGAHRRVPRRLPQVSTWKSQACTVKLVQAFLTHFIPKPTAVSFTDEVDHFLNRLIHEF